MNSKLLLCLALVLGGTTFGQPVSMPPPSFGPELPGQNQVKVETYWLAPYVQVSKEFGKTTVTWFAQNGQIKRQADVDNIEPGFVDVIGHGEIILGVNEDWEIHLPPAPKYVPSRYSMSGYITSTPDSRVFVHEYHPQGGMVAEDIYVHGKLAHTVGPFVQHLADEIQLNDDGSASLMICKDKSRTTTQIVTMDTNGAVLFRGDAGSGLVGPDGALLHPHASPDLGPNAHSIGWISGTHQCLYASNIGFDYHYELIDEDTGKKLWNVSCPGGYWLAIGLTPKYIIFAVEELYRGGPWRGDERVLQNHRTDWIRAFYTMSVEDGQVYARWQADYGRGWKCRLEQRYSHF
ncbi:MAG: hypothetical protein ACLQSR_02255 [Limisphaerales bacterium]